MITKKHDHRQYRITTCQNGLTALLIHDATESQSAIAMTVATGHFQDPADCPGLAHLLEHCLFAGCKAYPKENQINEYIDSYSGHINAWTAAEMTGFHIDCQHNDFKTCNHMLANLLTEPLFLESSITKEIQAIDAEFTHRYEEDQRRIHQVDKETCNPAHPFKKFSVGNAEIYQCHSPYDMALQLREFHQKHYRAQSMKLCLISNVSLDEMEQDILPLYEHLSSEPYSPLKIQVPLFEQQHLKQKINITPVKNTQSLTLAFALPDIHQWYRTKPESLISAMLGDEDEGSLLHYFKAQKWVTHLAAGNGVQGSNFKDYNINMQLTNRGKQAIPQIIEAVFHYLELIKSDGFPEWRFKERQLLNQLAFDYMEDYKSGGYANHLAIQMHHYPEDLYAFGEYILDDFNSQIGLEMLSHFTPDNLRIKQIGNDLKTSKTTQWYNTPYSIEPIDSTLMKAIRNPRSNAALALPQPNQFLPQNLAMLPIDSNYQLPQKIISHDNGETWYGQDSDFNSPKAELFISFESNDFNQSPALAAYTRIWTSAVQSYLNDHFYSAAIAGVYSHIYPHKRGVTFHSAGFSDKQLEIAQLTLPKLIDEHITAPYFEQAKIQRLNALNNSLLNKPINRLFATLNTLMHEHSYLPEELAEQVENANLTSIQNNANTIKNSFWQTFMYGNWAAQEANQFDSFVASSFNNLEATQSDNNILNLTDLQSHIVHVQSHSPEAAIVYYLQGLGNSLKDKAFCIVIEQLMAPLYFQLMRKEKQYGYQLGCGYLPFLKAPGVTLYIQSPVVGADTLYFETMQFLASMPDKIQALPQEAWEKTLATLSRQFGARDQNLSMKCQRLWTALDNDNQAFNEQTRIIQCLKQLSQHETAQYLFSLLNRKGGNLSLLCTGDKKISPEFPTENFSDVFHFRQIEKNYL